MQQKYWGWWYPGFFSEPTFQICASPNVNPPSTHLLPRPASAEPCRVWTDRKLEEPPRFAHSGVRRIRARLVPKRRDTRIGLSHNQKLMRRVEKYQLLGMSVISIRLRCANDGPERRTSLKRSKKKKKKKKKERKKKKK
jgi:hypothetical protein